MTHNPVSASLDDTLDVVARRLLQHAVSRLPVVRDGHVIGVVSRHDVLRRFARPDYVIAADIERAMGEAQDGTTSSAKTTVSDGDAVLSGFVAAPQDRQLLAGVAASIDGAVSIDNQLVVRPDPAKAVRHRG